MCGREIVVGAFEMCECKIHYAWWYILVYQSDNELRSGVNILHVVVSMILGKSIR